MSKNMFAALEMEEVVEQPPIAPVAPVAPAKPVRVFTQEIMAAEMKRIEQLMAEGMSWYNIFMRANEEKRWREEARFGKLDDWTDITKRKRVAPKKSHH